MTFLATLIIGTLLGALAGLIINLMDPAPAKGGIKLSILLGTVGGITGVLTIAVLVAVFNISFLASFQPLFALGSAIALGSLFTLIQHFVGDKKDYIKTTVVQGASQPTVEPAMEQTPGQLSDQATKGE